MVNSNPDSLAAVPSKQTPFYGVITNLTAPFLLENETNAPFVVRSGGDDDLLMMAAVELGWRWEWWRRRCGGGSGCGVMMAAVVVLGVAEMRGRRRGDDGDGVEVVLWWAAVGRQPEEVEARGGE
ncbi:hypothetical protein Tco_0591122 [Tanacetum coccineum]